MLHRVYNSCLHIYLYMVDWQRQLPGNVVENIVKPKAKDRSWSSFWIKLQQCLRYGENLNKCFVEAQISHLWLYWFCKEKYRKQFLTNTNSLAASRSFVLKKWKILRAPNQVGFIIFLWCFANMFSLSKSVCKNFF